MRLVHAPGGSQVVEEVNDRLAHMPFAKFLQSLFVEVLPECAAHLLSRRQTRAGHGLVLFALGEEMVERDAASWKTVLPSTSSFRPGAAKSLERPCARKPSRVARRRRRHRAGRRAAGAPGPAARHKSLPQRRLAWHPGREP